MSNPSPGDARIDLCLRCGGEVRNENPGGIVDWTGNVGLTIHKGDHHFAVCDTCWLAMLRWLAKEARP